MSNMKTGLGYSELTGRIYWGRQNTKTGTWSGDKKDVTSEFLQVMEHKFPIGFKQNIVANGEHRSTICNVSADKEVYAFGPVNPDDINGELYNKLTDLVGSRFFDNHGCCSCCYNDVAEEVGCHCEELKRKQTLIMELAKNA